MVTRFQTPARAAFAPERLSVDLLNRGEPSFRHDLQELTEAVQADRRIALEQARQLQLAAQLLLQDEAARLGRLDPQDLRVAALDEGAERARAQALLLQQEARLAAVRVPLVRKTEALLHGQVTDEAGDPAGPLTVTLVDAQGEPVEGVAPVEADAAGYYALVVPAEVAAHLPAEARYAVSLSHGGAQAAPKVEPQPLAAGVVGFQPVVLDAAALRRLHLREAFPAAPAHGAKAARKKARHEQAEPEDDPGAAADTPMPTPVPTPARPPEEPKDIEPSERDQHPGEPRRPAHPDHPGKSRPGNDTDKA